VGYTWHGHILYRGCDTDEADSQLPGSTMPSKRFKMLGPFVIGNTEDVIGAFQIIKWIGLYKGWVAAYWWPAFVAATRRQAAGGNH
jgi:hypothetical protein